MPKRLDTPTIRERFAARLRTRLDLLGMSGAELARRLGVSRGAVDQYKAALTAPTLERLQAIARELDCDPGDLVSARDPRW